MSTGSGMPSQRRRGAAAIVAVLCVLLLWGCSSSSDANTQVGARADDGSAAATASTTPALSGKAAALVGKWTNVEQMTKFCSVGAPIEAGGSSTDTPAPPTTNSDCTVDLDWSVMRTLDIEASGDVATTFVPPTSANPSASTEDAASKGTCTGRATAQGSGVHLSILHCDSGSTSGNDVGIDEMRNSTAELDDACLIIGAGLFAKSPGACDDQQSSAEEKFSRVGNAIENAN